MGFGKRRERTHALGKGFKRAFNKISEIPVLGDILNSTPLGSAVKVFGSAISGDLRGVAKSGLGLLPGAAGKIGSVVAEFIPEKSDEAQPISENMQRIRDEIEMENEQKLQETIEGQRLMREDPVFAKQAKEDWKRIKAQQQNQKSIGGASDAIKMFGGSQKMVGGKVFS